MKARVKWFSKGYGFLVTPDKESVFVHYSNIIADGYKALNRGILLNVTLKQMIRVKIEQ